MHTGPTDPFTNAPDTATLAGMEWLTSAQAAKQLGITPNTLYRLIDRGELVAYRFGRVIRIKQTDLEDFLERSSIQSGNI